MTDNCSQCSGCAFKPGADANLEVDNHLKGFLTVLSGTPFFCHDTLKWQVDQADARILRRSGPQMRADLLAITVPGKGPKVCAGWKAAVAELAAKGWFRGDNGHTRRVLAHYAIRNLREFLSKVGDGKRTTSARNRAQKGLESCMAILGEELKNLRIDPAKVGF